jgi:hypothetical protein
MGDHTILYYACAALVSAGIPLLLVEIGCRLRRHPRRRG